MLGCLGLKGKGEWEKATGKDLKKNVETRINMAPRDGADMDVRCPAINMGIKWRPFKLSSIKAAFFMNTLMEPSGLNNWCRKRSVPKCGPPFLYHQNGRRKAYLFQISFDQVNQNNHNIYNLQQSLKHKKGRER